MNKWKTITKDDLKGWRLKHLGGGVFEGEYVGGDEMPNTGIFTITNKLEQNPPKDIDPNNT